MIVVTRSAFVHVVGLLNTYLPLTVIVFVINVKWFTAAACRLQVGVAATRRRFKCNTGGSARDEVLQVYHRAKSIGAVDHPVSKRALIDFARVTVVAGASTTVKFEVSKESRMLVNVHGNRTL